MHMHRHTAHAHAHAHANVFSSRLDTVVVIYAVLFMEWDTKNGKNPFEGVSILHTFSLFFPIMMKIKTL